MSVYFENREIPFVIDERNKTSLYIVNSTIRETQRINTFFQFADAFVKQYGYDQNIPLTKFMDFASSNSELLYNTYCSVDEQGTPSLSAYKKKLSELNVMGLISYKSNRDTICFYKTAYDYSMFNANNNSSSNNTETISTLLLYIMKKRGALDFTHSLINYVEQIWINENKRCRLGVSRKELEMLYVLGPWFVKNKTNTSLKMAQFIIEQRFTFEQEKDKHAHYAAFIKYAVDRIVKKNTTEKQQFVKPATARDYIDVLCRTMNGTYCFRHINQFMDQSFTLNANFSSKLSYFINHSYAYIHEKLVKNALIEDLKMSEMDFVQQYHHIEIEDPVSYRFYKLKEDKKNIYLSYQNPAQQASEINAAINEHETNRTWYNFEHVNNYIMAYFLKFKKHKILHPQNLRFAIKMDEEGNFKNSTTSGVADFSVHFEDINIIIESSTQRGLSARKNEVPSVKEHAESIYDEKPKMTVVFIVLANNPDEKIHEDFIITNLGNVLLGRDIFYVPVSFEEFKKLFFSEQSTDLDDIIARMKQNINHENAQLIAMSKKEGPNKGRLSIHDFVHF